MDVRLVLMVVWTSGCAPRFTVVTSCDIAVPVRVTVLQEAERDCAYYEMVVADAATGVVTSGFATDAEASHVLSGRDVWVRANPEPFVCGNALKAWGCYHPEDGDIELTADATSTLHEMLHRLEHARGGPPDSHAEWDTRGAAPGAPWVTLPTKQRVLEGSWMHVAYYFGQRWWIRGRWGS
jgi:hypothetical protein